MIRLININKYYNKRKNNEIHVLNHVSLELPNTGLITFLGSSGSGKTTLLNVLGGLDKASGEIEFDDFKMKNFDMDSYDQYRKKNIGYIFQNYNLLYGKTVYDNLKVSLEIIGVTDKEEQAKRIEYCLKAVGMFNYRKKSVNALSGGQQQRVSIARALVKKSKVIIADEPTGNLDSKNSIDVMNILKSLSTKTLIVLVTHNKRLAYTYSDKIYAMKDGVITNGEFGNLDDENESSTSVINLKDLNKQSSKVGNLAINLYTESDMPNIDLKILYINNQFYFECDEPIKSIEDTKLELVDESIEKVKAEPIAFDDSFYQDLTSKNSFKTVLYSIKDSFKNVFKGNKHKKMLLVSLMLMGVFLSLSMIMLTISNRVDTSGMIYNDTYQIVSSVNENFNTKRVVKEAIQNESIDSMLAPLSATITYYDDINFSRGISLTAQYRALPYQEEHTKIKEGRAPLYDEVLVSETFLELICDRYKINYSPLELINSTLRVSAETLTFNLTISGITENDQGMIYFSQERYDSVCFDYNLTNYTFYKNYRNEIKEDGTKTYTIVKGRDVTPFSENNRFEILVNEDEYPGSLPEVIRVQYRNYYVVGSFEYEIPVTSTYITNSYTNNVITSTIGYTSRDNYVITLGREALSNNEIIVNSSLTLEIGSVVNECTVVGKFSGAPQAAKYGYISTYDTAICETYNEQYLFNIVDSKSFNKTLDKYGATSTTWLNAQIIEENTNFIFLCISIGILIVSGVFIYFIMRSMILDEKNEIVVYRALGKNRKAVFLSSLSKIVYLSICTCFLGYIITTLGYQFISFLLSNTFDAIVPIINYKYILIGAGALFGIVIVVGSLPYLLLLRKTPIEILSEYDM